MIAFSHFENTVSRDPSMIETDWPSFIAFMAEYYPDHLHDPARMATVVR